MPAAPDNTLPSLTPTPTPTPTPVAFPSPVPTATPTPTSPPAASPLTPPALTAAVAEDAIELRWDPVPGAVRYKLRVWWDSLPHWQPLGGDNITAAPYTHTGPTPGRKYYYTIQAVNAAGQTSDWQQDFASATVPAAPDNTLPSPTPTPTPTPTPNPAPVALPSPTQTPTATPTPTSPPVASPLTPPALTAAAVGDAIELRGTPCPAPCAIN